MNTIEAYLTLGKLDTGESHHHAYHNEIVLVALNMRPLLQENLLYILSILCRSLRPGHSNLRPSAYPTHP